MEQFIFYQDQKITRWERSCFFVTAESYEKALEYIKILEGEDLFDHEKDGVLDFFDCKTLHETDEFVTVEENNGQATIEVLDRDCNVVYDNKKRPKIALDDSGVTIPKNDYEQPIQIRQEVVQGICEAFLNRMPIRYTFTAVRHKYTEPTLYIGWTNGRKPTFLNIRELDFEMYKNYRTERIRGCEMKIAFKKLIEAGYHMFKCEGIHYFCSKKPVERGCQKVTEFNEFID